MNMNLFARSKSRKLPALILLLSIIAGCKTHADQERDGVVPSLLTEGEQFVTTVAVDTKHLRQDFLRSATIEEVKEVTSLRLLVFDEYGRFLYSSDATLGDVVDASARRDEDFLPDSRRDEITEVKLFKVSLYKSSAPRVIHFVANHDWSGFPQDYFAHGTHAGEFMTHKSLVTKVDAFEQNDPRKLQLWSRVEAKGVDESTFRDKVVKLLRTYSKVSVEVAPSVSEGSKEKYFKLDGYALINLSDRGSIAPFVVNGYEVKFSFTPDRASTAVDTESHMSAEDVLRTPSALKFVPASQPYYLFEKANVQAEQKVAMILKGHRYNQETRVNETRYYKLDLVRRKGGEGGEAAIRTYFDIIRNKHYVVEVAGINSDGFKTFEEAIQAPAGNNVFADTKLKDYKRISDGAVTLLVDPIQMVVVRPGTYEVSADYLVAGEQGAKKEVSKYLKYYPSWDAPRIERSWDGSPADIGYEYASGNNPYMGELKKTKEGFEFTVKEIPTDAIPTYAIEVVALRRYKDPQSGSAIDVDATTGATEPLTRKVRVTLTVPYQFRATLTKPSRGEDSVRELQFKVYPDVPKNLFPFPVYIKAPGMTPLNDGGKKSVLVEHLMNYQTGKYEVYYKYMVQEQDQEEGSATLSFRINDPSQGHGDVNLLSEFYQDQTIFNDKKTYKYTWVNLYYFRPYELDRGNSSRHVPTSAPLTLRFDGKEVTSEKLLDEYGIHLMIENRKFTDWYGRTSHTPTLRLVISKEQYEEHKDKTLEVSSFETVAHSPQKGYVRYHFTYSQPIEKWMVYSNTDRDQDANIWLSISTQRVEIRGRVYFNAFSKSQWVWVPVPKFNETPKYWLSYYHDRYDADPYKDDLSGYFKIDDIGRYDDSGTLYYDFSMDIPIDSKERYDSFRDKRYLKILYPELSRLGHSARTLEQLESNPEYQISYPDGVR